MSEAPKSTWKKPLKLPGLLLGWLVAMIVTMLVCVAIAVFSGNPFTKPGNVIGLFIFAALVATFLLGPWLFIHWLCNWKNFRRFLFACACLATFIALFYAEETWRGKRAWNAFQQEWMAKGEKFDFNDFISPSIPDSDNFAMAPIFDATRKLASRKWREEHRNRNPDSHGSWDTNLVDPLEIELGPEPHPGDGMGNWQSAKKSNLKSWQQYYRDLATRTNTFPVPAQPQSPAQDVLLALSTYNPVMDELRQARLRPDSRFPLDYDDEDPAEILLPQLAALKRSSRILELRALAELENGQSDKALEDVKLSMGLVEAINKEPFIISVLVRISMLKLTLQPVWEGLAAHQWSDAQLTELDSLFAKLNFLADYKTCVRGERAMHLKVLNWLEQKRSRYWLLFDMVDDNTRGAINSFQEMVEIYLMPKGWYYQSERIIADMDQRWILPSVDEVQQTVSPQLVLQAKTNIDMSLGSGVNLFARLLVPSLEGFARKSAGAQNAVTLARTAIALERYRLAHGEYPPGLDALAPQFMDKVPHDIIGGQPLKYRRDANGRFILYSIGWNEPDDGGTVVASKYGSLTDVAPVLGDWVWQYPAK